MIRSGSEPAYALRGFVEIGAEPPWSGSPGFAAAVRQTDNGRWECVAPGLEVSWTADQASHAATDESLCVVWGRPRCGTESAQFAAPATAESLLSRLRAAGTATLGDIRGGFGIFFVDANTRRAVLAVDRFSIETACFAVDGNRFAFSERADAVPLAARTISSQSLYDYLYFHCIPSPATVFSEVRRLGNGSHACVERGRLVVADHWTPRFEPSRATSFAGLGEQFRSLIRAAVEGEATGADKLGCFLSGGTDSSTIAGMLGAVTGERARTYSIGFDAAGYDEMAYARIAARHFGTDHHEYYVTPDDLVHAIPEVAAQLDQPFGNSSLVPALFCARMAGIDGVTRMLGGDGGDELFGGNTRYRFQLALDLYTRLPAGLRERAIEPALASIPGASRVPGLRHAAGYVRNARIPMPDRLETHNLLSRIGADRILHADLLAAVDTGGPLSAQRAAYARSTAQDFVDRMLQYDWRYTLADSDLPKVRSAVSLAGMSVGYPFLADEIADFSMRLPADYKVRNFRLRWFFKEALRGFLPDEILKKKKHGFGLPFGPWVVQHAGLRDLAGDSLRALEGRGVLREGFRDELIGKLLPAHPGYYGELAWILMMLEQWLAVHGGDLRLTSPSSVGNPTPAQYMP